ncbi:hypothetical protein H0A36_01220 [Endozoicomonas sp. SM1973]|uniref:Type 4 fimbrial biogenesis protein PilX N-terminal domain-containing protein n=1 Tax=Spartinivicinus marinus TaxID=2994442 RepID=A0A853I1J1_9GAMM|nr:PilX N-terminal domain-containing pilus assembly protein [Spartinivicinus marinus]MCX4026774.1 hypothetical protein [Spartinivicinus marinus]NYZ64608.1 hypothetical protein [Spartinivicinus marinus]
MRINIRGFSNQRGVTLIVCLMILLVVSIAGITLFKKSYVEQKISHNEQRNLELKQAALSELRAQFRYLEKNDATLENCIDKCMRSERDEKKPHKLNQLIIKSKLNETSQQKLIPLEDGTLYKNSVNLEYKHRCTSPPGFSLLEFVGQCYQLDNESSWQSTGGKEQQAAGLNYAAPKPKGKLNG